MPSFYYIIAKPILTQFVPFGSIHRGNKLKCVKRLAAGVHLLEDHAYSLLGSRSVQRNYGQAVVFKILQNLMFKKPEFFTDTLILISVPILVEAVLPLVPIKDRRNRIH